MIDGHNCGMKFPQSRDVRCAAVVLEILEGQPSDLTEQRLRQVAAILQIEFETVGLQLRLDLLTRRTVLAVHGRFDDHPGRVAICRRRDLQVHVAVARINARVLQERVGYMEQLKLAAGAGRVRRQNWRLRPTQNRGDSNFLRCDVGQRHMLRRMTIVNRIRLEGQAVAQIRNVIL